MSHDNNFRWLTEWYKSKCDGYWEHYNGISIVTIDNPGWSVRIDFEGTGISINEHPWTLVENGDQDWYGYEIKQDKFDAAGDPSKLETLIGIFRQLVE